MIDLGTGNNNKMYVAWQVLRLSTALSYVYHVHQQLGYG